MRAKIRMPKRVAIAGQAVTVRNFFISKPVVQVIDAVTDFPGSLEAFTEVAVPQVFFVDAPAVIDDAFCQILSNIHIISPTTALIVVTATANANEQLALIRAGALTHLDPSASHWQVLHAMACAMKNFARVSAPLAQILLPLVEQDPYSNTIVLEFLTDLAAGRAGGLSPRYDVRRLLWNSLLRMIEQPADEMIIQLYAQIESEMATMQPPFTASESWWELAMKASS